MKTTSIAIVLYDAYGKPCVFAVEKNLRDAKAVAAVDLENYRAQHPFLPSEGWRYLLVQLRGEASAARERVALRYNRALLPWTYTLDDAARRRAHRLKA